jgi:hypothetical protein
VDSISEFALFRTIISSPDSQPGREISSLIQIRRSESVSTWLGTNPLPLGVRPRGVCVVSVALVMSPTITKSFALLKVRARDRDFQYGIVGF